MALRRICNSFSKRVQKQIQEVYNEGFPDTEGDVELNFEYRIKPLKEVTLNNLEYSLNEIFDELWDMFLEGAHGNTTSSLKNSVTVKDDGIYWNIHVDISTSVYEIEY